MKRKATHLIAKQQQQQLSRMSPLQTMSIIPTVITKKNYFTQYCLLQHKCGGLKVAVLQKRIYYKYCDDTNPWWWMLSFPC